MADMMSVCTGSYRNAGLSLSGPIPPCLGWAAGFPAASASLMTSQVAPITVGDQPNHHPAVPSPQHSSVRSPLPLRVRAHWDR
eukprot:COSAG02_NODE_38355_length_430_cov_0.646526_1_plen_82_part_01